MMDAEDTFFMKLISGAFLVALAVALVQNVVI